MSTKIYDAYVFDKNYSVAELNKMFVPIKGKIKEYIKELYEKYVVKNFVFYLDYLQVVGKDEVESIWEKIEPYDYLKEHHKTIFGWLLEEKYLNMCMEIYFMFIDKCKDKSLIWRNYDSSIQIIPYEDKLLAMYFGNSEFIKFINECKFLTDFHYQDQTDKPDDISEEEWKLRKDIWDVAIGPDYIPSKHGVNLKLSNIEAEDFAYIVKMKKKYIPSMEERVNTVLEAIVDNPFVPINTNYLWNSFKTEKPEEYQKIIEDKKKEIRKKLKKITAHDLNNMLKKE